MASAFVKLCCVRYRVKACPACRRACEPNRDEKLGSTDDGSDGALTRSQQKRCQDSACFTPVHGAGDHLYHAE
jgi:hypothetical protein